MRDILHVLVASFIWATALPSTSAMASTPSAKLMSVTIDWVPTPEYYGFFYAKERGIYKEYDLDVDIRTASGAPIVAAQLAAGQIYLGTTTSDNILRRMKDGASYTYLIPLARYNPVSIVSLSTQPINSLDDLIGKVLGVNVQAGPYAQFRYLINRNGIPSDSIREFPIDFGGAVQLQSGKVQGFLAYTTNQAVDLEIAGRNINELYFEDLGVETYGLVLAAASRSTLNSAHITDDDVRRFLKATLTGYTRGAQNIEDAVESLVKTEPQLNRNKLRVAIRKMDRLNADAPTVVPSDLDAWVDIKTPSDSVRDEQRSLFSHGLDFIQKVRRNAEDR